MAEAWWEGQGWMGSLTQPGRESSRQASWDCWAAAPEEGCSWVREQREQGHWKEKEAEGTQELFHLQGFRGWEPRVQREMLIDEL